MELDLNQMAVLQNQNRWIGRLQGVCFAIAILWAGAWIIEYVK